MSDEEPMLRAGQVFGPATVVGPACPEYRAPRYRRYVRVACWSCREERDVAVRELVAGRARCPTCWRQRWLPTSKGSEFFEPAPNAIGSLRELDS